MFLSVALAAVVALASGSEERRTSVSIVGDGFHVNGKVTYAGRSWNGRRVEGLLFNSRMVQATFDDLNPETVGRWAYPDTGRWDAGRNTDEFVAMLPTYRAHGLLAVTVNLQGGSPTGYSQEQPWHNSAITPEGKQRPDYMERLARVIDAADRAGMVVILGLFYFGQDERLEDEAAVVRAVDNAVAWVLDAGYTNVVIEINNECDVRYDHAILQPGRVHELIERVKSRTDANGRRLLAGTSFGGGTVPTAEVVGVSDFVLIHGNGVNDPAGMTELIRRVRALPTYRPMPVVVNEDDHFGFDQRVNNFTSSVAEYASWGYFDYRMKDEEFDEGFQSVPVNWSISSERKRGFFRQLSEITGESP